MRLEDENPADELSLSQVAAVGMKFIKGDPRAVACGKEGGRVARLTAKFRGPKAEPVVLRGKARKSCR